MYNKYSKRDIINFFLLYSGAVISVYLLPDVFAYIYFGILLILFWRSDKNAFWFILVFLMLDPLSGLFPEDYNYGLPFIKGINLRFIELFVYVAFFKAIRRKNRFQSVFLRPFQLLFFLTIFLLLYTLFLNSSIISIIIATKWIFIWSLIYTMPKLIDSFDEWTFFFRVAFIIVLVAFLSQVLQLALGYSPAYLLGTNFSPMMDYGQGEFVLSEMDTSEYNITEARPISSSSIILTGLIGAMFFLQYKRNIFPRRYLYLIIIMSYVSILLTATRGWFIAFSIVIFIYLVFIRKIKRIIPISLFVVLFILMVLSIPILRKQLAGSVKRLSTIEAITSGDISAGGTNARGDYSIELMKLWKERPVLGWGFSEFYKEHSNGHAGLANLIFSVGIIGFLIFIYFWYKMFFIPITTDKRISIVNPYKGSLIVFSISFFLFFILNATSGQQFGIYMGFGGGVFSQIVFYSFSSHYIINAFTTEYEIRQAGSE